MIDLLHKIKLNKVGRGKIYAVFVALLGIFSQSVLAQPQIIDFNHFYYRQVEKISNIKEKNAFTALKPLYFTDIQNLCKNDSTSINDLKLYSVKKNSKNWFFRKIFAENLIIAKDKSFQVFVDPAFNLELAKDLNTDSIYYINTRGFKISGNIGNSFAFNSSFYENQGVFPDYVSDFTKKYAVVPGSGYAKTFKNNGYDYSMATGSFIYKPNNNLSFQFGNDKNFIGYGYRSLLLSDNAYNYPFLRSTYKNKYIQYSVIYSSFSDIEHRFSFESGFLKKYASFHFCDIKLTKSLNLGIFESTIWQAKTGIKSKLPQLIYLQPLIGINTAAYGLNNTNNNAFGLNTKYQITKYIAVYGQLMIDNWSKNILNKPNQINNKYAYQLGVKYFDAFTLENLNIQLEYNTARPYTFGHFNTVQNYIHYNQALAHPCGANFKEILGMLDYRWKRIMLVAKLNYIQAGKDTANEHFGNDIFKSDFLAKENYSYKILQGALSKTIIKDVKVSFLINEATNMNLSVGYFNRIEDFLNTNYKINYIYIAFKTSLSNIYFDF